MQNKKKLMILNYIPIYNLSYICEHKLIKIFYFLNFFYKKKFDHEIYQKNETNLIRRKIDFIPEGYIFKIQKIIFHTSILVFLHFLRFLGKISKYVYGNLSDECLL